MGKRHKSNAWPILHRDKCVGVDLLIHADSNTSTEALDTKTGISITPVLGLNATFKALARPVAKTPITYIFEHCSEIQ